MWLLADPGGIGILENLWIGNVKEVFVFSGRCLTARRGLMCVLD